jgi:hypothetical protein
VSPEESDGCLRAAFLFWVLVAGVFIVGVWAGGGL